ncbi:MAG: hypothetical protein K6E47_01285 [Lachnospiraceae bacterium]|nr:hypothetical protein [Lachnospiraceae bacterium]
MIPSILLALTVIIVMIDVLVGIHRGFGYSVVRLLIWIIGSVICALIARSVTVWLLLKIAKVPNMNMFAFDVFGSLFRENTSPIGTHLTGTIVSFAVPVVFIGLFIVSKFITWLIYCLVKVLIKNAARRAEAHNAAVDAVKAIRASEMEEAEKANDQPIPQPSFHEEEKSDFGTFGIYPKEEPAAEPEALADEVVAQATENITSEAAETESEGDGFEAIAASGADGFESLAKSMRLDEVDSPAPVKQKKLRRRHSISMLIIKKSVLSSVLGGILGLFISLYAGAIIYSPICEISRIIKEEQATEAVVNLFATTTDVEMEELITNAFSRDSKKILRTARDFSITSDLSIRSEDFVEAINADDESVVYYIYKYTGATGVASLIYNSLTPIDVKEIGLDNKGIDTYNFPDTLRCYMGLMDPADKMMNLLCSGNGFNEDLLDGIDKFFDFILKEKGKGEILLPAEKTALVNALVNRINEKLVEVPGAEGNGISIPYFENYAEARQGLKDTFEFVKRFIRAGIFN